jgi:phosphoglucosamine mutase
MSNMGLELYLKKLGLNFHRTKVGDRYIIEYMRSQGAIFGGEPSGHIIFGKHSTTGDGALAAIKVIEAMKFFNSSLNDLAKEIVLFPQVNKSIKVVKKPQLDSIPALVEGIKNTEIKLNGKGRTLLRYSGTEPLLRVMVEGENEEIVKDECQKLVDIVLSEIGS